KAGQAALARAGSGKPGAFVAMDPYTGEIFAMGSAPTFDPNELAKPLTEKRKTELYGPDSDAPLVNRAVSSQYSTGSTFKPVTALAALAAGVTSPGRSVLDQGKIQLFPGKVGVRQNAGATPYGPVDLRRALSVSSDIYFYVVGKEIYYSKQSRALQSWARRLGFGRLTDIDTGAETKGIVPSRAWRDGLNEREADCRAGTEFPSGDPKPKKAPCGIADGTDRPFGAGDNVNLAIGQGDLQATPLQVALSYAAIATGGKVPTPHLGVRIEDEQGKLIQRLKPKPARKVALPDDGLQAIRDGLRSAASDPGGTSTDVFAGWDHGRWPIHGKTGTAQTSKGDQSWYAAYVPRTETNKRPLLVVATVERGGFGAEAAAPLARQIFSQWYTKKPGDFKAGENATR
ncbi:MAG: penicillin-binding transpeptidase domain-containing protein, partial [Actinomycetota bacterium]|nr:penicillin-binding transpeptidase domain-containing protein [Actinomycetota bacterium]